MPRKRPYVASLDQVRITRDGDTAIIEYADPAIGTTYWKYGPEIQTMTDRQILARWNESVEATEDFIRDYEHVCVEIPLGKPQLEWHDRSETWVMCGDVLRGCISDDEHRNPVIEVDGREMSWEEFGRTIVSNAGWGFRLYIVPDDETHEAPEVVVREPDRRGP